MSAHRLLHDKFRAPFKMTDPGASGTITVDRDEAVIPLVSASGARTLAAPTKAGISCLVQVDTYTSTCTLTVTGGYNQAGTTDIIFGTAGDWVCFKAIKIGADYKWRIIAHEGTDVVETGGGTFSTLTTTALTATTATVTTATATTLNAPAVAAEHGTGIIGTAVAPVTTRRTVNGDIITEFKIDLTGLASVATGDDIICLTAGGLYGFIGRNVVATNGIIYKTEMICVETPAGGDNDINVVVNSSGTLTASGAGGTTYGINGGDWTAGKVVENLVQGLTANHYFYLTGGAGDTADTYTAGMFIIRWYGHALLA